MLCFHKQRHTVSIQRRLLGFVKAWASLPSRTCYPSSIKVYKSGFSPFWEFSSFQCLSANYFLLKKLASVILHYFVYKILSYIKLTQIFYSLAGQGNWLRTKMWDNPVHEPLNSLVKKTWFASLDFILIKDKDTVIKSLLECPLWVKD